MSTTLYGDAPALPRDCRIFDGCVSGGTLSDCIQKLMEVTEGNLCVRIQPTYMVFSLPCPLGIGTPITREAARERTRGHSTFFSPALQTCYCTLLTDDGLHGILFDTPDTLRSKYQLAQSLGVPYIWLPQGTERKNAPQNAGRETHICEDQ